MRVLLVEHAHVPEGKEALKEFVFQQGFKFYMADGLDFIFFHPDLSDGLEISEKN